MATSADFIQIGDLDTTNSGLLSGIPRDLATATDKISEASMEILSPLSVATENLIESVRHPVNTLLNKHGTYLKLLKFIPSAAANSIVQCLDKPFATAEKTIEYALNNSVSKSIESVKGVSTKFLANIITTNGESTSKTANFVGKGVEGLGDLTGSIIKSPFWLLQKSLNRVRNTKGYGTQVMADKTNEWMNNQQLRAFDYLDLGLTNGKASITKTM